MASINKPPILDETGQAILSELERLTAIAGPPGEDYVLTSADKQEIAGMVDVSGKMDEPATEGTSGQVLTTDGQGGRSWQTVHGGGETGWNHLYEKEFSGLIASGGFYKHIIPITAYDSETGIWTTDGSVDLTTLIGTTCAWVAPSDPAGYAYSGIKAGTILYPQISNANGATLKKMTPESSNIVSATEFGPIDAGATNGFDPTDFALWVIDKPSGYGSYISFSGIGGYDHYAIRIRVPQNNGSPNAFSILGDFIEFGATNNLLKRLQDNFVDVWASGVANYNGRILADIWMRYDKSGAGYSGRIQSRYAFMSGRGYQQNTSVTIIDYNYRGTFDTFEGVHELMSNRSIWGGSSGIKPGTRIDIWGW